MEGATELKFASFCSSRDSLSYGVLFSQSQIFQNLAKNLSETASQEEQNGTNFSFLAPSSEEL